ncbi:MAG: hypothetical protein CMJ64_15850 [Planctomycetaceae bacterium]|nr:hypothetical protein [Planctomycetaceae bacterium]
MQCVRPLISLLFVVTSSAAVAADRVPLHGECEIEFTSIEVGQAALRTPDRFTRSLSRFDLEFRLSTNGEVSTHDLRQFAADQVVAWNDPDRAKLAEIVASVRERFSKLKLPLPETILLIQTTGKEEMNFAYCRRNAIIFPKRYVAYRPRKLEEIFVHEVFHILSSHNEELRRSLYEIVGYKPCPEITLPPSLADRKITNPDGPSLRYYIEIESNGALHKTVPLIFAKSRYEAARGEAFFDYLQFRLLIVDVMDDQWKVALRDKEPVLIDPDDDITPSYREQIGKNTTYVIHPDEILADNFMHLVMQTKDLPTPRILEQMWKILQAETNE